MKIKYKEIEVLVNLLSPIKLDIKESLSRRRFLKLFREHLEDKNETLQELREKYVIEENGKLKIVDNQLQFKSPADKKKFIKEVKELNETEVEVDLSKNKEDLETCSKLLENHKEITIKNYEGKMTEGEYLYVEAIEETIAIVNKK